MPEACGLRPSRRRRRTPGLRRDEVSALAGISTAYYTWIEQGRKFDVSTGVLEAIADALRLDDIETSYVFMLAGKATPQRILAREERAQGKVGALLRFATAFVYGPAMLLEPWLDVVAVNRYASEVLGITCGTNLAEALLYANCAAHVANGDALAGAFVALLRRNHALDFDNDRMSGVIANLRERNAVFKTRWDSHVIEPTPLLDLELNRRGARRECFQGIVVSDPIAVRQFALFMYRTTETTVSTQTALSS